MVRKMLNLFLAFLLVQSAFCVEENEEVNKDEKTVSKRGIFHLNVHGIHGHHHHIPAAPHFHVAAPHSHISPHVHLGSPHVHHFVPKIHKPIVPYHIHHGGATVTSYNVNYPRVPFVPKAVFPGFHHHHVVPHVHSVLPHHHHVTPNVHSIFPQHHHHAAFPHFHASRPIVPIAVPGIRIPKYPVVFPQKPIFIQSKPQFVPIPIPAEIPSPIAPLPFNTGSENEFQNFTVQQAVGNCPHDIYMIRPAKQFQPPYNYHAHKLVNEIDHKMTNNFQVSGQGQQLAQQYFLHQSQPLIQEPQSENLLINFFFLVLIKLTSNNFNRFIPIPSGGRNICTELRVSF